MFSPAIVTGLLRQQMGWTGIVMTDDVGSAVAVQSLPPGQRAVAFVAAGGDVVLTVDGSRRRPMTQALVASARRQDPHVRVARRGCGLPRRAHQGAGWSGRLFVSRALEAAVQIPRPSDADKEFFRSLVDEGGPVEVRPMFGNLGAFVNGNMYAGLFGSSVGVKLDDAGQAELLKQRGAGPYGPEERPMGGWVAMPDAWRRSPDKAAVWVGRALAYVQTMPPKAKKTAKKAAK